MVDEVQNWVTTTYSESLGHELSAWQSFIQGKYKRAKKYDTLHTHTHIFWLQRSVIIIGQ